MEHYELVQEMPSIERMSTQERLKHARKRRSHQMKKWNQYEKQLEKENSKKKKHPDKHQSQKKPKRSNRGNIKFAPNIVLLEAAARNDLNEVKRLLDSGVDPDVTNEDGLTALHQCCIDDSEELMKLLLDHSANVNACDSEMWTPLHAAATCGHMNLCKHLIDRGAELLAVNADGNMPYDICDDELTLDFIETEMSKRGITQEQIDVTRLATEHQMLADLREFVGRGGDMEQVDHTGATMLHIAAANGYIEVAEFLLDNHVSVDVRDHDSWQPIHAAAYWAQQEIMELLVDSGADLDSKTKNGETPFDLCEEPDLKQKILDMKDEIETKRVIRQQRPGSQRKPRVSSRNASIRRSSMRGDKTQLFKKEHKEEALHFGLNLMNDEELLMEEEEPDHIPATDLDEVTITVSGDDDKKSSPPAPAEGSNCVDSRGGGNSAPATITTVHVNKPTPKPRTLSHPSNTSPSSSSPAVPPHPQKASSGPAARPPPTGGVAPNSSQPPVQKGGGGGSGPAPPQPRSVHPPPDSGNQTAGPTLSNLKRERSNSRENLVDQAMQDMFLESVHAGRGGDPTKTKNGHNNNNNNNSSSSGGVHYNAANNDDGQLRRFVAPEHSSVIGGEDEDRQQCCVIL